MYRIVLITIAIMICVSSASAFGDETKGLGFEGIYQDRATLETGKIPPASNPPTPTLKGDRDQFLWEDFESTTFPPTDWDTVNTNPGYGWFLGTYSGGGTQAALVTWDQEDPVELQDEWLITPELDVSGASSQLRVEFYMLQGYDYPHDFKVYVTLDDGTNWTEVFDSYGTGYPEFEWYFVSVPLDTWAGSSDPMRIGFQYYGTDADIFGLDNIEVTDDDLATGRCCVYTDPLDPDCYDGITQADCSDLGGTWSEGLDCTSNPCPLPGEQLEPSDDMYTDPDEGSGHSHPIEETQLWTADFDGAGHHERIMIKWDLSSITEESADSAFINIYRYFRCPGDYYTNCDLFTITEDWDEDTWNEYNHISHSTTAFMTYNFGPALDWYRIDISDVVNDWLAGATDNYGIVIQAQYGQKWSKFYSKEGTYAPYLEIYGISGENQCPVLDSIENYEVKTNILLEFTVTASDPDLTNPNLFCEGLPEGASFVDQEDGTGIFEWTPSDEQAGYHDLLFYADDGELADSQQVSIRAYRCGNADNLGGIDIDDVVYLIQYLFAGGPAPDPLDSGDVDCSSITDIDDVVYLITYLFQGGYAPCDPDNDGTPDC